MESSPACTYFSLFLNSNSSRELNLKGDEHFWPQSISQHASHAMLHSQQCDYSCFFFFFHLTSLHFTMFNNFYFIIEFHIFFPHLLSCFFFVCLFLLWLPASNGLPMFCMDEKVGGVAGLPFFGIVCCDVHPYMPSRFPSAGNTVCSSCCYLQCKFIGPF